MVLLLGQNLDFVSQIAWDLVHEAPNLANPDGGWKEFRLGEQPSSLYASLYVFRLLSQLTQLGPTDDLLGEPERFMAESLPLLENAEEYLISEWYEQKWRFGNLPWDITAPNVFTEYAPFSMRHDAVEEIYETLRQLVAPSGRLIHPAIGVDFDAPEYALSVRVAHALRCTDSLRQGDDQRRGALEHWVLDTYSDSQILNTCDIAFLCRTP